MLPSYYKKLTQNKTLKIFLRVAAQACNFLKIISATVVRKILLSCFFELYDLCYNRPTNDSFKMILLTKNTTILYIPENTLHCWQTIVGKEIFQRLHHTIVRDTFCCVTLKVTAKVGQLYKDAVGFCVKVTYKSVVFKVSVGDLLHGTVKEISEDGIRISFEYCHDISVLKDFLTLYGHVKEWTSRYKIGDLICFRISYIRFNDDVMQTNEPLENGSWYRIYGKLV